MARQVPADELLAAAVAVDVGGVQERDARLRGGVQHGARVVLVDLAPVGPELPGAEPDDGDGPAGPAQDGDIDGDRWTQVLHARSTRPGRGRALTLPSREVIKP